MFYVLGPFDKEAVKDRFPVDGNQEELSQEERDRAVKETYENGLVHFGKVEVSDVILS